MPSAMRSCAATPFAAPPPVVAMTRALAGCAQLSANALRGWLPPPARRRTRPVAACASTGACDCASGRDGDAVDDPLASRLIDALRALALVVPPALADAGREGDGGVRKGPTTLPQLDVEHSDDNSKDADAERELAVRYPAVDRIVAIGDVHGDHTAFTHSLRAAGLIDEKNDWAGGKTVLVQVGDQLDRGDDETSIYETLFKLQDTAPKSGGAVHILLGNHEIMNVEMDFRYVTDGGFADFERPNRARVPLVSKARIPGPLASIIRKLPSLQRARARALSPGGPLAIELARRSHIAVIIGDNVFVHGGLAPRHLTYGVRLGEPPINSLEAMNVDCRNYMMGVGPRPMILSGGRSPVWMRDYSDRRALPGSDTCRMLAETLKMINVRRMIVGHTPQEYGINAACSGRVWRIDTGMSAAYGGIPEALEISRRGRVRIYNAKEGVIEGSARAR